MRLRGDPNDPHTLLKAVFHYYCRFGRTGAKGAGEKTLDSANFSKLCRDSPDLLGPTFSTTDVDLIFIKAKKKGERRISYTRFLDALGMIAMQKYSDLSLEASVPKLLEAHLARLPCMMEFTNGKMVQAIWQKRAEREDPAAATELPPLPPLAPTHAPANNASASEPSSDVSGSAAETAASPALPPPAPTQMLSTPTLILAAPLPSSTPLDATTVAN
ncbi:Dead deah box RNA helicase, partial [Globisporangium splendens]